ncbi:hypothetical protein M5K25_023851 [Dendrobium thyrsiflorum]|uniref:RING-type domain-containing protein n=1 Tax=Dendrobium thyrsiflorum TaxID=117978 RepID=A0ABD0U0J2_DENTH
MAVHAQYLSDDFTPDFQYSRVEAQGGVLEGIQMLQSHNHQIGQFFYTTKDETQVPAGVLTNVAVLSDHPQSDLTCNVSSSCRKRRRDEPVITIAAPMYSQLPIRAGTIASSTGFRVSGGLSLQVIESTAPSTSEVSSVTYLPYVPDVSPELLALLYRQNNEIDTLLRQQSERLRWGMEEVLKRCCQELLSSLSQRAIKRLREKDAELENASRRNAELEEKARQISAESLIWFNLAKNNEAVVTSLRTSLEQAMIQNITAASASPPAKEGFGESNCSPFPADDAQSCCFDTPPASGELRRRMVCKVCNENDICVLVLPCRHLCLCKSCDGGVDTCPICHSHKNATLQIFMS